MRRDSKPSLSLVRTLWIASAGCVAGAIMLLVAALTRPHVHATVGSSGTVLEVSGASVAVQLWSRAEPATWMILAAVVLAALARSGVVASRDDPSLPQASGPTRAVGATFRWPSTTWWLQGGWENTLAAVALTAMGVLPPLAGRQVMLAIADAAATPVQVEAVFLPGFVIVGGIYAALVAWRWITTRRLHATKPATSSAGRHGENRT